MSKRRGPERKSEGDDLVTAFLGFMDERREDFTARYAAGFGHLDPSLQLKIMFNTRLAMLHGDMAGLQRVLSEGMVIVPGDNSISRDQIDILTGAYSFNREHWDKKLNKMDQGGLKNGKED